MFHNFVYFPGEASVFCYRSGKTVYEEILQAGTLQAAGWNGAGYTHDVIECDPSRLDTRAFMRKGAFYLEANGCALDGTWRLYEQTNSEAVNANGVSVRECAVYLRSTLFPLEVCVHTRLDGTCILERYLTLHNLGDASIAVSTLTLMGGGLELTENWRNWTHDDDPQSLYRVGCMEDHRWAHEGLFRWHDLPSAGYNISGRYLRDRFRHPMFLLQNKATGTMYIAQLAWSGGYTFAYDLDAASDRAALSMEMRLDSPAPFLMLQGGEAYETPHVHIGMLFGGLDDAVQAMHDHMRKSVFTIPEARGVYGWVEAGLGPERVMDMRTVRHFADTAAAVGAETLILDAGWFCPAGKEDADWGPRTGDWVCDPEKYPDDLRSVREYIHGKGLLFGLWADIECMGRLSGVYRAHPDWSLGGSQILDLTQPEAAAWVEAELTRILTAYEVDVFRLDNNTHHHDFAHYTTQGGRQAAISRYYEVVYAMYARLRKKFPDVVFENCAGGGGRSDLGLTALFSHTWVSDWQKAPRSVAITNGMTMALPPERVDRLIGGMGGHRFGALETQVRHAIFGRPTVNDFNTVGTAWNPEQIDFVRHTIEIYKQLVRPHIPHSRIWHHTPECNGEYPAGNCILERSAADGEAGILGVFRLAGLPQDEYVTVYPRGVDLAAKYDVTLDNTGCTFRKDGFVLRNDGVRVYLPSALQSELLTYKKVREEKQ